MTRAADPVMMEPGDEDWWRCMTSSKVAAMLGLSPYESPFSLWFRMKGIAEAQTVTAEMMAGHYLEDAICRYVADQLQITTRPGGTWRSRERPWAVATPDRRVLAPGARPSAWKHERICAVVEAKAVARYEDWGRQGTDDIPPHVRAQVLWQLDVLDLPVGYVGALLPNHEFRWYEVRPYEGELEYVRAEARAFLDSLAADQPPNVDSHDETYRVLRALHPEIEDRAVDIPPHLAVEWTAAVHRLRAAENAHALARARIAQHMGRARKGTLDGITIACRQANGPSTPPYVKAPNRVPLITMEKERETDDEEPRLDHPDIRATG